MATSQFQEALSSAGVAKCTVFMYGMKARLTDLPFVDDILSANDLDPQPTVHLDLGIYDRSPPGVIPIVAVDLLQQTVDLL